jgi:hypothetical protein
MIFLKASMGCAPEMRCPLTKAAGVPDTPIAQLCARTFDTFVHATAASSISLRFSLAGKIGPVILS